MKELATILKRCQECEQLELPLDDGSAMSQRLDSRRRFAPNTRVPGSRPRSERLMSRVSRVIEPGEMLIFENLPRQGAIVQGFAQICSI
jgi:hypothetical protein